MHYKPFSADDIAKHVKMAHKEHRRIMSQFESFWDMVDQEVDHVSTRNIIRVIDLIDTRADLIDAEQLVSGDRYGFLRDIYLQKRAAAIANGELDDDFDEDF